MALEPAVVLMDEPFSNLDTFIKDDVEKVAFRALKDLGVTVIQITHDPVDALRYSDEIIVLRDAEVIEQKAPEELYRNPSSAYTASLTGPVNILSAEQQRSLQLPPERWFIRPEQIEINQNGIPATVNEVNFCGAFFYTELKLNEDFMLIAHLRNKLRKGEMVSIAVRIEGHL